MKEIDILDADATTIAIKKLILESKEFVVLVCPYLDLSATIVTSIQKARERQVSVRVIYRADTPSDAARYSEREKELKLMGCEVAHCRRLHTKCYLNEQFVIISSLNLLTSSQSGNFELSTRFDIESHSEAYKKVMLHLDDIYRLSGAHFSPICVPVETAAPSEKPKASVRAPKSPAKSRVGKHWTKAEENRLARLYLEKIPYTQISEMMKRTESSVKGRLVTLGFLDYNKDTKEYVEVKKP